MKDVHDQNNNTNDSIIKVAGMYKEWFLDYASYVNLERSIPDLRDGLKPVQRRIMQSMKDKDDGRYNKVANLVGHTMQYHPHGDASIADAMVQIGQKDLLIDMQGNWGNILTGDRAAASRYIEARLSEFAKTVVFNPKITQWKDSYDGRKQEPITLPVKFPLLLTQGTEGIGVGISTMILPHNFNELLDASIRYLRGKSFKILPDFPTGGIADCTQYNDGQRGGKLKIRARIEVLEKQILIIKELPFGITTTSLIDGILKANDKGKIKIKKIEDNTAAQVAILIHLPRNVSPDKTIDALYAFTPCQQSISPICCIIEDKKPVFRGVSDLLRSSTDHTVELLKQELEIQLKQLEDQQHFASLERIFIENRIYRDIEESKTWEDIIRTIDNGLKPFIIDLIRPVTEEDIIKLTEIKIKRISKYDLEKNKLFIETLKADIAKLKEHLSHLVNYAIAYFKQIKNTYGKQRNRKTEIAYFENVVASKVVTRNMKLYADKKEGFVGTSMKKSEYITDCSEIDDIIVFRNNGTMIVTKVTPKNFIGKDIIHLDIFKKQDKRTIYNIVYRDGRMGATYIKRFYVSSITRDKEYDLTQGNKNSKILYFSPNPNGEAEQVTVLLRPISGLKKLKWDIDFAKLAIKGRTVKGNLVTRHAVKQIRFKSEGVSTLEPRKIWFDKTIKRLNTEERGDLLGSFKPEDQLLIISESGKTKTIPPNLSYHFESDMIVLEKWIPEKPISVIYFHGQKEIYFVKRFLMESNKEELFLPDHHNTKLYGLSTDYLPMAEVIFRKKSNPTQIVDFENFISIKGIRATGNQLTKDPVKKVIFLEPKPYVPQKPERDNTSEVKNITTKGLFD